LPDDRVGQAEPMGRHHVQAEGRVSESETFLVERGYAVADVVGVGDIDISVKGQGVLPMVAGLVVLADNMVGVGNTGVDAALLIPITALDGQGERGSMLGAGTVGLASGLSDPHPWQ
jgi:hypothetical protein